MDPMSSLSDPVPELPEIRHDEEFIKIVKKLSMYKQHAIQLLYWSLSANEMKRDDRCSRGA